ncbi:hypothetical protein C4559_04485 [Candidatus Microgenomates bacterium]|nr:MAG: hypothetical protein C4559_04485 [Candidatus Microgenomates bacterium]
MHCRSCEILIEDELIKIPGVKRVAVSHKKGTADIYYSDWLNQEKVGLAISNVGYSIGKDERGFFSKNPKDYFDLLVCFVVLLIIYFMASKLGIFDLVNSTPNNFASMPIVLLIGLTAGFSTCMALVGGLVLGASAKFAEKHPEATPLQKFKPHLFFNIGRIISYTLFGGIIGFAGSFFQLSPFVLGVLTIIVGVVMFILGAQLTEISPKLRSISFTLPKSISKLIGIKEHHEKEYSHKNSIIMGAMTFFLPCGFTQAMQLYAISTGDPIKGALTMGVFAIGTAPGLLGIGGLTSVIQGAFAKSFFKFAGIVVVVLALFNISNGYNLTGLAFASPFSAGVSSSDVSDSNVTLENGVQIARMDQNSRGYSPNSFTVRKEIPVKWIISSETVNSCAASIVSSKLGVRQSLQLGENIIEFTPTETGQIGFSCSMGMFQGVFNVVDSSSAPVGKTQNERIQSKPSPVAAPIVTREITSSPTPTPSIASNQVQLIQMVYTLDRDIVPNRFVVKAGIPARMEIDSKDTGRGCMASVMIPGLSQDIDRLTKDKITVFEFTPEKPGKYLITCAMGVPRGEIIVE